MGNLTKVILALTAVTAAQLPLGATVAQQRGPDTYLAGATRGEAATVERWLAETRQILTSDRFHENLRAIQSAHPRIWLSQWERYRTPAQLSQILRLQDPQRAGAWWVPTSLALVGAHGRDTSWDSGYSSDGNLDAANGWTGYEEDGRSAGAMRIGRVHYDRYANGNQVERSCAVNTLAHEISHTLSHTPRQYLEYFIDTGGSGPERPGEPYASYLIGSLAQCTYLQNHGRIQASQIGACVTLFGVDRFNSNSCNDFPDGTPVIRALAPRQPQVPRQTR